jgi:hypothetical protein
MRGGAADWRGPRCRCLPRRPHSRPETASAAPRPPRRQRRPIVAASSSTAAFAHPPPHTTAAQLLAGACGARPRHATSRGSSMRRPGAPACAAPGHHRRHFRPPPTPARTAGTFRRWRGCWAARCPAPSCRRRRRRRGTWCRTWRRRRRRAGAPARCCCSRTGGRRRAGPLASAGEGCVRGVRGGPRSRPPQQAPALAHVLPVGAQAPQPDCPPPSLPQGCAEVGAGAHRGAARAGGGGGHPGALSQPARAASCSLLACHALPALPLQLEGQARRGSTRQEWGGGCAQRSACVRRGLPLRASAASSAAGWCSWPKRWVRQGRRLRAGAQGLARPAAGWRRWRQGCGVGGRWRSVRVWLRAGLQAARCASVWGVAGVRGSPASGCVHVCMRACMACCCVRQPAAAPGLAWPGLAPCCRQARVVGVGSYAAGPVHCASSPRAQAPAPTPQPPPAS